MTRFWRWVLAPIWYLQNLLTGYATNDGLSDAIDEVKALLDSSDASVRMVVGYLEGLPNSILDALSEAAMRGVSVEIVTGPTDSPQDWSVRARSVVGTRGITVHRAAQRPPFHYMVVDSMRTRVEMLHPFGEKEHSGLIMDSTIMLAPQLESMFAAIRRAAIAHPADEGADG